MKGLKGDSIHLRLLEPDDLDWLFALENNSEFWEVSHTTEAFSRETLRRYIANAQESIFTAKQLRFVIQYNDVAVGLIDLFDYDPQHHRAGVGILVLPKYQARGFATAALSLLITYSFRQLQLHQLFANITTDNSKSIRLFQHSGFDIVGTKKDWIFTNGIYKDEYLLQLINKTDE